MIESPWCPPSSYSSSSFSSASSFASVLTLFLWTHLACKGQVSRISHPPQSSLQLCYDPVPHCHTWPEGFPGKTKGLTMNFALTRRHSLPLNRRLWDLMKVSCEYVCLLFLHWWLVSQSLENCKWLNMHFCIYAQRHDLDLRVNSIMWAEVHVWEVSACIFNVAFYLNESNRGCAPGKMRVHLLF